VGIAKRRVNVEGEYHYRGIDDVYDALSPLLAEHKLCILPRILERHSSERVAATGELLVSVYVRAAFDIVSAEDGSAHVIESFGEALDNGDKATSKAMTAAYKYGILQAFCIPARGMQDADETHHKLKPKPIVQEPVQGWEQWSADIVDMIRGCTTVEAIDRVQGSYRPQLTGLQAERADFYAQIGAVVAERRSKLRPPPSMPSSKSKSQPKRAAALLAPQKEKQGVNDGR
jgi:hypothetical protein